MVRGVFQAMKEPGAELPTQSSGELDAHITVMRPEEIELLGGPDVLKGDRGKRLGRLRSEYVERSFAHVCETGGARRSWLRGLEDVTKRYLMCVAGRNLGVIMRALFGMGKPRTLQTEGGGAFSSIWAAIEAVLGVLRSFGDQPVHRIRLAKFAA